MPNQSGIGYDVHRKADGRPLVLGGVTFESKWGLEGHSDADVLMHAIGDALLGSVALGDLGDHFPPGEERWKNAAGEELLRLIRAMLQGRGARIVHVDSTIIAEEPHIAGRRDAMRGNIAQALRIGIEQVSVKATTNEKLGAIGRGEGIAAMAIATVEVA
jgi:2-C-methyl-D-erythritol 2,4-cyclodiphosphate synthase